LYKTKDHFNNFHISGGNDKPEVTGNYEDRAGNRRRQGSML
jgi:hypothetical protein